MPLPQDPRDLSYVQRILAGLPPVPDPVSPPQQSAQPPLGDAAPLPTTPVPFNFAKRVLPTPVPSAPDAPPGTEDQQSMWERLRSDPFSAAVELIRGATGFGDQGPPGPTWLNAGALASAALPPIVGGGKALLLPQAKPLIQAATPEALSRLAEQFPSFAEDLSKYRTGETLPPALGHLSDVLMQTDKPGVYALKPEVQARIAHFLELGKTAERPANWQGSTSPEILRAFSNDPRLADIWARMFGATSAGTGVPRNAEEAARGMWYHTKTGGKPFTLSRLEGWGFGLPEAKYSNMNLAQLQEMLSGDKVEAFAQLMRDLDRLPLDRHAIYGMGGITADEGEAQLARHLKPLREYFGITEGRPPKYAKNGAMYGTITNTEAYTRVEQALGDTLRTLAPDEPLKDVFAQFWEGVREQRGGKFQGGPIDLMTPRGLMEPGAMTDPQRILKALRMTPGKEWTPAAVLAALVAGGIVKPDGPPEPEAPASTGYSSPSAPAGPLVPPRMTPR